METIILILISVASTLGVVAIVTAIVVAFFKLKNKVDYTDLDSLTNEMNQRFDDLYRTTNDTDLETRRVIDSRCDKLDTKIQNLNKTIIKGGKQLLTD